ncbi:tRNA (mnm(5)s(2)U34)-methyltransferase [Paenibacillus agricola]|uniref:SAM-dependent methyltransferase n=1 Tax=Paenibacillus agricola TaxID=2716264 RepID=A0ABX0JBK1_9BACL|nr:class I SAM-dependent methyltransferase [Paenibacillus agricola]NHN32928.1 SAM-dependent methyltransferase [Paenibacillus agricola]
MSFLSILNYAQKLVEQRLLPGDIAIDATAGNGGDTAFLARLVGTQGAVHAFDIQEQALIATEQRLAQTQPDYSHVRLHLRDHAELYDAVPEAAEQRVGAAMFNLGYLPGGDHQSVTAPHSTIPALQSALTALRKGGIVTIVLYTGHPGGTEEASAVQSWVEQLPQKQYQVLEYRFLNQKNHPPYLIAVEKL